MKIFITGVAGLMGSHLAERFLSEGHEVYGVDNLSIGLRSNVPGGVKFAQLDLRHPEDIDSAIKEAKPDIVHHCAAWAHEGLSSFSPKLITENIYNIFLNTLVPSIKYNVKWFVQYSSMAVYGAQTPPFDETLERKPVDVYGIAKAAAEAAIESLSDVHEFKYTIIRPHNLIGERQLVDPYRNVAMIMMNRIMQGKAPIIYGDGEQKRAFSYVGDAIPCLTKIGMSVFPDKEIINIGPTEEYSINTLAKTILKEFNSDLKPIHMADRPKEVKYAWCTNDKAKAMLGFETKTSFEEAIHKMVSWAQTQGPRPFKYLDELELTGKNVPKTWLNRLI
ncbi:NAD-dependent epimerase/dehydratase family protein [Candidatus Dojkabacteria bacterium]|jgi:UDP-glucose 4-epimerase|nr:NAD-dependent epimerase/dehydratase family protein [Candidatus Dojkabacteria bacterium]